MSIAPSPWELAAQMFEKSTPDFDSPLDLAQAIDPRVRRSPELELINEKLVEAFNTPDSRLIIHLPPQRGKSQLTSRWFTLWALTQNPELRTAVASYEMNIARRWGRTVRDDITQNTDRLGMEVRDDLSSQSEWQLRNMDGGMFTTGVGGAMTGRSVDLLVVDDPVKGRAEASSRVFQERTWSWWTDVAMTRLTPGAPVVLIATRWDVNDLSGKLLKQDPDTWKFLRIPAMADHNPSAGEADPLGREPGEYLTDVRGTTTAQWEQIRQAAGPKTFQSLFQGTPTLEEGGIFPTEMPSFSTKWWTESPDGTRYVPGIGRDDQELVQSWDLSFKGGDHNDFVVGQVWLRIGADVHLLDMFRGRVDFNRTLQAIQDMKARWPQSGSVFIEDAANGPAVINSLQRTIPGIIPVTPEGGKEARAHAVSPFFFSGNVHLPSSAILPNVQDLLEEMLNFGSGGGNDDTIDAMTQAVNKLLLHPINQQSGGLLQDYFDDDDWTISPY